MFSSRSKSADRSDDRLTRAPLASREERRINPGGTSRGSVVPLIAEDTVHATNQLPVARAAPTRACTQAGGSVMRERPTTGTEVAKKTPPPTRSPNPQASRFWVRAPCTRIARETLAARTPERLSPRVAADRDSLPPANARPPVSLGPELGPLLQRRGLGREKIGEVAGMLGASYMQSRDRGVPRQPKGPPHFRFAHSGLIWRAALPTQT